MAGFFLEFWRYCSCSSSLESVDFLTLIELVDTENIGLCVYHCIRIDDTSGLGPLAALIDRSYCYDRGINLTCPTRSLGLFEIDRCHGTDVTLK